MARARSSRSPSPSAPRAKRRKKKAKTLTQVFAEQDRHNRLRAARERKEKAEAEREAKAHARRLAEQETRRSPERRALLARLATLGQTAPIPFVEEWRQKPQLAELGAQVSRFADNRGGDLPCIPLPWIALPPLF